MSLEALLDDAAVRDIARRSIHVQRGERIHVAGNAYGLPVLDPLVRVLRERGARVSTALWSDETLVNDLLAGPAAAPASRWMPQPLGRGRFRIAGFGETRLDKAVVLFSSPVEEHPLRLGAGRKDAAEIAHRFHAFRETAGAHLHEAEAKGFSYVLLDLPSRPAASFLGLSFDAVLDAYRAALTVDPAAVRKRNRAVAAFFRGKDRVRVTCPRGTDFAFRLGDDAWRFEDLTLKTDRMVQLPGGEAYLPPVTPSGEGAVVAGPDGFERKVVFRRGKAVEVFARRGKRWIAAEHPMVNGREPFCEFGVGTNPAAPAIATGPIYEKAYGTVHFGVGGNAFFGGPIRRPRHRDFIVENPRVEADGVLFAEGGEWVA